VVGFSLPKNARDQCCPTSDPTLKKFLHGSDCCAGISPTSLSFGQLFDFTLIISHYKLFVNQASRLCLSLSEIYMENLRVSEN